MQTATRREFFTSLGIAAGALAFPRVIFGQAQARRPNVLVIYTDDQGSIDANCYGATDLVTPAIDGLAARGLRMTQFYAPASVCSPSRAGLLTGRYPWLIGRGGNAGAPPVESLNDLGEIEAQPEAFGSETTMAEVFKAAGYATAHVGKWHLNSCPGSKPLDQGFDYSFGHMGGCIDNYTHFFYWNGPNRHDLWENNRRVRMPGRFFPDLMVEKATGFIKAHRAEPFFMYFALNMPHYPYQGDAKWLEHYKDLPYPRNLYAAFLSTLDERIGALMAVIDGSGLRDDTIIVFQSDNGHSTESRAHGGGGNSGPYRGAKFSLNEGGIRLPAIISWPGHLPEGEERDQVAHGCDWLPTVAELAGVTLPTVELHGRSLVEVLRNADAPTPHEELHWQMGKKWAVRSGPWKLIMEGKPQLYNIDSDPGEELNLAGKHADLVQQLTAKHKQLAGEKTR